MPAPIDAMTARLLRSAILKKSTMVAEDGDPKPGGALFLLTCIAANHSLACLGTAHPQIVGDRLDQMAEHVVAGQAEHEVGALCSSQKSITFGRP
jgi:hypothetical protein